MPAIIKMPNSLEDYAIVELQGDIQADCAMDGRFLGNLFFGNNGIPMLIIGNHLMYGKESKMEKPLAMLRRVKSDETGAEYHVNAIIRQKILFKTRPKPIVGTPGKGK
ncbi:PREDICTED: chromosome transmission fidelity protein 8 homolog [Nicrophorus vespilloides]|uniref:Chromosome transmission fidelity protein 8 homolog n=1 Tax=Nicrophorus vespilloides TaxID=110193 RepID=A0ABM1MZ94_NICVS|nr:PREDICTED: chromosome transmission fidelity protein 8 homolog [Nicrophorus vespilloides]